MSSCARYLALLVAGLFWQQGPARAGDLEDCKSGIAGKLEAGCTAFIKAQSGSVDDRTIAYVNRSRFFANHAKPDLSLKDADAAIALNPRSALALSARAYAHQRSGRFDQAISDFTAAAQLDPGNPGIWASRGLVKNEQKAWADARTDFDKAIALRQDFAPAYIGRARGYIETAELDKALSDLNTAISINPSALNAFFLRAVVYRRQGDVDKAIDDVTRAIAQTPQPDQAAFLARAQLFIAKGDYARAIADFDQLLTLLPGNAEIQRQRQAAVAMQAALAKVRDAPGESPPAVAGAGAIAPPATAGAVPGGSPLDQAKLLFAQKRFPEAIARLGVVLTGDPNNEQALRLRAIALMALNRIADSQKDIDELVKLKPNDGSLLALRAIAEIRANQPELAMADVNRAINVDPNNAGAYLARGAIERAEGKSKEALADLDRSIALNARDGGAFTERGQIYMALNQLDKALADYDQAIVLNPLDDTARAARGLALLAKGNSAEGLLDIKNALDRNPNNQLAQVGQGLAMLVSGQYDRSIVALNQLVGRPGSLDTLARLLRARAQLGRKDADNAMADLNTVLGRQPANPEGLLLRGIAWSAKHDYAKALDDLSAAIAQRESVEGYFARAKAYEAQNIPGKAEKDYERATELRPTSVFDLLAQAESKQKVKQLSKQLPCGNAQATVNAACL